MKKRPRMLPRAHESKPNDLIASNPSDCLIEKCLTKNVSDEGIRLTVNSGPKLAENQRFEIAARPHLAVDLLVANLSGTPCPVKAAAAEGGGQRPACVSDMSGSLGVKVPCAT